MSVTRKDSQRNVKQILDSLPPPPNPSIYKIIMEVMKGYLGKTNYRRISKRDAFRNYRSRIQYKPKETNQNELARVFLLKLLLENATRIAMIRELRGHISKSVIRNWYQYQVHYNSGDSAFQQGSKVSLISVAFQTQLKIPGASRIV